MLPSWVMPDISLWCADCFDVFDDIETASVDLVIADLPYGTTSCPWDSVLDLERLWKEYARVIKRNAAVILTAAQPFTWRLCASKPDWFKYEIIWEKRNGTAPQLVYNQPFRSHENILVFYQRQPTYNPQMTYGHSCSTAFEDMTKSIGQVYNGTGARKQRLISRHRACTDGSRFPRSVQSFEQESRKGHPTKKPVGMMRWLIRSYSNPGDLVLDNTMGEGSTGLACVAEQRRFYGIEKAPVYYHKAEQQIADAYNAQLAGG